MSLRPSQLHEARRREAPFILRALVAATSTERRAALNEARGAIEASRQVSLELNGGNRVSGSPEVRPAEPVTSEASE